MFIKKITELAPTGPKRNLNVVDSIYKCWVSLEVLTNERKLNSHFDAMTKGFFLLDEITFILGQRKNKRGLRATFN